MPANAAYAEVTVRLRVMSNFGVIVSLPPSVYSRLERDSRASGISESDIIAAIVANHYHLALRVFRDGSPTEACPGPGHPGNAGEDIAALPELRIEESPSAADILVREHPNISTRIDRIESGTP